MEPTLLIYGEEVDDGGNKVILSRVPLSICNPSQCDALLDQLYEKYTIAARLGSSVAGQLKWWISQVQERLMFFETGVLEKPVPPKVNYSKHKILDD
jgi:hypothetical protein